MRIPTAEITISDLKKLFETLPEDTPIYYDDPNFSGPYDSVPDIQDFKVEEVDGKLSILIQFPFESHYTIGE